MKALAKPILKNIIKISEEKKLRKSDLLEILPGQIRHGEELGSIITSNAAIGIWTKNETHSLNI